MNTSSRTHISITRAETLGLSLAALSRAYGGDLATARELAERAVAAAAPLSDYHRVGTARAVLAMALDTDRRFGRSCGS